MVGKALKSKINGSLFLVEELKNDNGNEFYVILDMSTGKRFASSKDWLEQGIMQNMEILADKPSEKGGGNNA